MAKEWDTVPLGDVAEVRVSNVDKHLLPGEEAVRLCNYLHVYRNGRLRRTLEYDRGSVTKAELDRFGLRKGDVLITKDSETPDDIGVPGVVLDDLPKTVCGYHLALLRPKNGLDSQFLGYCLQSDSAKRHFLRYATGVTRFGLSIRAISSFRVPVASPDEQAAVARILDAVDTAIERTRDAVSTAGQLRRSLLADLLSSGIGQNGRVRDARNDPAKFQKTPLGKLPATWKLSTVGQEFELQNGFTLNEGRRPRSRRRRYLRVANVQRDHLSLEDIAELDASDAEFTPRVLQVDDLLVVEGHADRMQIGRCARVTKEAEGMTFQNHLFRLRAKREVLPYFGCLWLNSAFAQRYWNARCATSSGLNTINQRTLKRLAIPVPEEREQKMIETLIRSQRQHLQALSVKVDKLQSLKKSLMDYLLTGKIRVNLANLETTVVA